MAEDLRIVAVAHGTDKTLLYFVGERTVPALVAAFRRAADATDAAEERAAAVQAALLLCGTADCATNAVNSRIAARAERLAEECDFFFDLDHLAECVAEAEQDATTAEEKGA